jgi:hypothetical protein
MSFVPFASPLPTGLAPLKLCEGEQAGFRPSPSERETTSSFSQTLFTISSAIFSSAAG